MELVLAQLPLTELLLSHSLVCRTWRGIIQRETFLPHRKSYYQYKLGRVTARDKLVKEQVELVLAQLPLTELLLSHSLVCRTWRNIIQRETFVPPRKSYYQYKSPPGKGWLRSR